VPVLEFGQPKRDQLSQTPRGPCGRSVKSPWLGRRQENEVVQPLDLDRSGNGAASMSISLMRLLYDR
jgi:hypothetical protein